MSKKVLNFDKFISEKERDTVEVHVLGETIIIPAVIPAIVPVMMARAEDDPASGTKMIMRAADILFGSKKIDELCAKGLTASDLADLVQRVFQTISGADSDEDDQSEELTDEDEYKPVSEKNEKK